MNSSPKWMEPQRTQRESWDLTIMKHQRRHVHTKSSSLCSLIALWLILASLCFIGVLSRQAAAQQQVPSKVDVAFNRFYNYDEYTEVLKKLVAAYPELLTLQSIGKSEQG